MPRGHERKDVCRTNGSADRFAHEVIAQRMTPSHGLLGDDAHRRHEDQGHRPKRGVGIDRRRAAKRR